MPGDGWSAIMRSMLLYDFAYLYGTLSSWAATALDTRRITIKPNYLIICHFQRSLVSFCKTLSVQPQLTMAVWLWHMQHNSIVLCIWS